MRNVKVKNYIDEQLKKIEDESIADAKEVMKYLTQILRGELDEEVVVVEGEGDGFSSAKKVRKEVGIRERNKAAELLGKRYSLFTDKMDVSVEKSEKLADIIDQLGGEGLEE